jgi:hypothetical protein
MCELELSKCCLVMECVVLGASWLQEFGCRNVMHNTTKGGEEKRSLINDKIGMIHWMYFTRTAMSKASR